MKYLRLALAVALATFLGVAFLVPAANAASTVTVAGQTRALNGTNVYRSSNFLVMYTPAYGATTSTNQYGYEAAVVNGKVTQAVDGVGNMAIPAGGFVLSGHGTSRTWLKTYAKVGAIVALDAGSGGGTGGGGGTTSPALLPDLGVRVLRQFTIARPTSGAYAGKKLLKFPGVTSNIGKGPLEVVGHRSSSTSTDWVATQHVYNADGTKTDVASPNLTFYYAGDGHNHWHMKDVDDYELFDPSGRKLRDGEKHGFCFEDNTSYRDWPTNGTNGTPSSPYYDPAKVCGVNQPNATDVMHGLSVGWGDTYPATLPDQGIDVTGLPDGNYTVKLTADGQNFVKESNESNNVASALIKISGNTVSLLSTSGGL
jgi:hypothetical protein